MSGLLEADIDLGLESGAAAFDPFSRLPATTITTTYYHLQRRHYHRHYRHQNGSFPPPAGYTSLARRSKFTSVSYVSPRPIMDSSFSSRSRGSEPRATRSLPSPSASLGRHPTRALSHFRISLSFSLALSLSLLVDPWRFVLFGPVYPTSFSPSPSSRDSVSSPFSRRERAATLPRLSRFVFVACSRCLSPPNSSLTAEDRSPYLPRFAASTSLIPGSRQRLRVQSTRLSVSTIRVPHRESFREGGGKERRIASRRASLSGHNSRISLDEFSRHSRE